jgi:hypothetical protein
MSARPYHFAQRHEDPHSLSYMASCDVATNICQALYLGAHCDGSRRCGRGVIENMRSTDVESPTPPPHVRMSIHPDCISCTRLGSSDFRAPATQQGKGVVENKDSTMNRVNASMLCEHPPLKWVSELSSSVPFSTTLLHGVCCCRVRRHPRWDGASSNPC